MQRGGGQRGGGQRGEGRENNNGRKRPFEGGGGWRDKRSQGSQVPCGRGGKRGRFESRFESRRPGRGAVQEAEDGEVVEGGDEVMGGVGEGFDRVGMDFGAAGGRRGDIEQDEGDIRERGGGNPVGGLVDYGSDDSD